MAVYLYQARTITGHTSNGKIEAQDEAEARLKLRARKLIPVKVTLSASKDGGGSTSDFEKALKNMLAPKLTSKELQVFTRQFATLINAGIPIADSIKILGEGSQNKLLKESLQQIQMTIETGRRLSESLQQHPQIFDRLYCNMIQAGEEAGIIDTILNRLSTYLEKNEKIKSQVKGALIMPIVITVVAILVITGIILFVIPKFQQFYQSSGKELPALTQLLINFSEFLREKWYMLIGSIVGVFGAVSYYLGTADGKKNFDTFILNAQVFGDVVQKSSVARMSRTLSTLLSSGVGLIDAIDIASKTAGNYVIETALANCKEAVTIGRSFNFALQKQKEIPLMVTQMVGIGEQSGSLDTMLSKIADFYEDEVETAVKAMTSLIEPLMMVVLGGLIAGVLIAMYLPIFSLGDTIG